MPRHQGGGSARARLRHAFLARLARRTEAPAFVVRGGVRIQRWLGEGRPVGDVDLVATEIRLADAESVLRRALDDGSSEDGVVFHPDRVRVDRFHPDSPHEGLRLFAAGSTRTRRHETRADLVVDVVVGLPLWPRPGWIEFAPGTRLRAILAPTVVGTKLKVLGELGPRDWRAKDLIDALLVMRACEMQRGELGEGIERAWASGRPQVATPGAMLASASWWSDPRAEDRFRRRTRGAEISVAGAVAELRAGLRGTP
ncbi:MAG: nucleotidyl transferase AbiEii/AbiGii toxin family protein [Sandaracinaceae bacterium]